MGESGDAYGKKCNGLMIVYVGDHALVFTVK
jgi:hypothetical protein